MYAPVVVYQGLRLERTWTGSCFAETAFGGGEHVGLVVGRVEVFAVPAGGEVVDGYRLKSALPAR